MKFYLIILNEDIQKKPRFYQSDDNLMVGDHVLTKNYNHEAVGRVVGILDTSEYYMKEIIKKVGGYYPLAYASFLTRQDLFVRMGICNKPISEQLNEVFRKD